MKITQYPLGPLEANCYVIAGEQGHCAVVDPGGQGRELAARIRRAGLKPQYVLLTHGHYDHVGGVQELTEEFPGLPVYLHQKDTELTPSLCLGLMWTAFYDEGDTLPLDELTIRVLHTPGHTPGSVCLLIGGSLFTGDTLFEGSCGRVDFPGGSWQQMLQSLGRLGRLEGNYPVFPGHGAPTDLAAERAENGYMKEAKKK